MELPTYTSIWRIEKRLYKLYDFRLPMPVPVGQIAVFAAITVPYVVLLTFLGLPFTHTLFWLYVLPPGVLTWLATRPVLESKRLPELMASQLRYISEPSSWCRMAPTTEKDEILVTGRVWRRAVPATVTEPALSPSALPVTAAAAVTVTRATATGAASAPASTATGRVSHPARPRQAPAAWPGRAGTKQAGGRAREPGGREPAWNTGQGRVLRPPEQWAGPADPEHTPPPSERVQEQAVPEQIQEQAVPERVQEQAVPERVREQAVPERVQEEAVPERVREQAVPERVQEEAVPERVREQPVPERVREPGLPEPVAAPATARAQQPGAPQRATAPAAPEGPPQSAAPEQVTPAPARQRAPKHAAPGPADATPAVAAAAASARADAAPAVSEPVAAAPAADAAVPTVPAVPEGAEEVAAEAGAGSAVPDQAVATPAGEAAAQVASGRDTEAGGPGPTAAPAGSEWAEEPGAPEHAAASAVPADLQEPAAPEGPSEPVAPERHPPQVVVVPAQRSLTGPGTVTPPAQRSAPAVERALGGPGTRRSSSWRSHVSVTPGGRGPGRPDLDRQARERAVLPLDGPRLVVVLGCTVGAGQTMTTFILAELLAELRGEPVAALDLNPGPASLATLATQPATTVSALLANRNPAGRPAHAAAPAPRSTAHRGSAWRGSPRVKSQLDVISEDPTAPGLAAPGRAVTGGAIGPEPASANLRYDRLFSVLASRYTVSVADPGASAVSRVLPAADQLVLVVPASPDAAQAVGMTCEWLEAHGHGALSASSIAVVNGVSQRSMPHAEQAELAVRGRCRAIVRVPWDDHLAQPQAERGIRASREASVSPERFAQLRPAVLQAHTALAGVLVATMSMSRPRTRSAQ